MQGIQAEISREKLLNNSVLSFDLVTRPSVISKSVTRGRKKVLEKFCGTFFARGQKDLLMLRQERSFLLNDCYILVCVVCVINSTNTIWKIYLLNIHSVEKT